VVRTLFDVSQNLAEPLPSPGLLTRKVGVHLGRMSRVDGLPEQGNAARPNRHDPLSNGAAKASRESNKASAGPGRAATGAACRIGLAVRLPFP
jgi:hypothetical protein